MTSLIPKRILVLDDDVELRTMLGHLLNSEGYQVTHAANGREALSLHRQSPFDLAIIELLLTNHDGLETFAELRCATPPPKLIATSKSSWMPTEIHLKTARHLGAHGTLAKPFTADQFLATVRKVLNTH